MIDTSTLQPKEIEYLKFLKGKWLDATESFKKLENARSEGKFWETQKTPTKLDSVISWAKKVWWVINSAAEWVFNAWEDISRDIWEGARRLWADISKIKHGNINNQEDLWFLGRQAQNISDVWDTIKDIKTSEVHWNQWPIKSLAQATWFVAGGVSKWIWDAFWTALSTATPDAIWEKVESGVAKWVGFLGNTSIWKKVWEEVAEAKIWLDYLKENDPDKARSFQSAWGGWAFVTDLIWGVTVKQSGKQVLSKTWDVINSTVDVVWDVANKAWDIGKQTAENVSDAAGKVVNKTWEFLWDKAKVGKEAITDKATEVTSGLSPEQIKGFQANPYQKGEFDKLIEKIDSPEGIDDIKNYKTQRVEELTDELTGTLNNLKETRGETSKVYWEIRKSTATVNATDLEKSIENVLKSKGIDIVDGNVVRKPWIEAGEVNAWDIAKFDQLLKDLRASGQRQGGFINTGQTLDFRKTASNLAKFDANTTTSGQSIMKAIRKEIDNVAKAQIPWLKELDAQFVDKLTEVNDALRDLIYKQGDVKWEFKSNINQIVATLNNSNRKSLLKRLEEVSPWIKEKVEAINNIPNIHKALQDSKLSDNLLSTLWAVLWFSWGLVWAWVWYAAWKGINRGITAVRRQSIKKAFSNLSSAGQQRLKEINAKVERNEKLNTMDKSFRNNFNKNVSSIEKNLSKDKSTTEKNISSTKGTTKQDKSTTKKPTNTRNTNSDSVRDIPVTSLSPSNAPSNRNKAKLKTPSKKKLAPTKATKKEAPKKTVSKKDVGLSRDANEYLKSIGAKKLTPEQEVRLREATEEWFRNNGTSSWYNKELTKISKENGAREYDADEVFADMMWISMQELNRRKKLAPKKTTSEKPKVEKKANTIEVSKPLPKILKNIAEKLRTFKNSDEAYKYFQNADIRKEFWEDALDASNAFRKIVDPNEEKSMRRAFNEFFDYVKTPKKSLDNTQGFINPTAIWKDVSKALSKLTPKNIYFTANTIGKKLWVEVKKVQAILKEYVAKYGEELKWKTGELFDELADKLKVRSKLIGNDWAIKEVGKVDSFKKMGATDSAVFQKRNWVYREKISDIIKSDDLLKKYPEVKNGQIYLQNNNGSAFEKGTANRDLFAIYVWKGGWDNVIDIKKSSQIEKKMDDLVKSWKPDSEIESQYLKLEKELEKVESESIWRILNSEWKKIVNHELQHVKQELKRFNFTKQEWLDFDEYYNLPEEVEARKAELKYKW